MCEVHSRLCSVSTCNMGIGKRWSFENTNLALAARNNPRLVLVDPLHVNVYDVVNSRYIVLSQDALQRLTEALES